ncbi:MAG: type II secretion system F family protein [Bryobacterales bacterium]|nr:type II secretion system F family protein [Bryobacterales bacterium]
MLPAFLVTAISSIGLFLLLYRRLERKENAAVMRRLSPEFAAKEEKQEEAEPLLIQPHSQIRSLLAGRILERLKLKEKIDHLLETADVNYGPVGLVHRAAGAFLAGSALGLAAAGIRRPLIILGAGFAASFIPVWLVKRKAAKRIHAFEEQFPDCLEFISRSMRAGHAFSVALEMVHKEFPDPLSSEFRRIFEEQNLGQPLDIVLRKLGDRVPSLDCQFFISAVLLQKRTGGNLAELLDKLAGLIRERFKLRARIRAISAQGLMSGRILAAIPIIVGVLMFLVNREYAGFFINDETGQKMMMAAIGLQVFGYMMILKMVKIEV